MKVLVIGSGGREHALVWKLRHSPRVTKIYCAPGNGGIAEEAECLAADVKSLDSLTSVASQIQPDLTVVGPELPLMLGVVDEFTRRGWRTFGPTKAAAQLETSKSFAKEFLQRHRIPTAHYAICTGFMALGMMLPGMWSGWLQDHIGYRHFFTWVIFATAPSFIVALGIPLETSFGKKAEA